MIVQKIYLDINVKDLYTKNYITLKAKEGQNKMKCLWIERFNIIKSQFSHK